MASGWPGIYWIPIGWWYRNCTHITRELPSLRDTRVEDMDWRVCRYATLEMEELKTIIPAIHICEG